MGTGEGRKGGWSRRGLASVGLVGVGALVASLAWVSGAPGLGLAGLCIRKPGGTGNERHLPLVALPLAVGLPGVRLQLQPVVYMDSGERR